MAYRMTKQPMMPSDHDGDEPGDITESPEQGGMEYIKDFVTQLDETEFAYLQDCIGARVNGKDKPDYKSPEEVEENMEQENASRSTTKNASPDEEE